MSKKKEVNEKFISNLKFLMEYTKEDKNDLSTDLDVDVSTINNYLSGRRSNIEADLLTKIAIHYRCSKELLLYGDVSEVYNPKREFECEDVVSLIQPPENIDTSCIEHNVLNENEIIVKKLKDPIFANSLSASALSKFIVDCEQVHKMLKASYKKNKCLNVLIWIVWYELLISIFSSYGFEKDDSEEEAEKKAKIKNVLDGIWCDFEDKNYEDFFKNCQLLKNSKWSDLVYYYIALRFVFGFGDTVHNIEENRMIGIVFLKCLRNIGNKYAANVFGFADKYYDI